MQARRHPPSGEIEEGLETISGDTPILAFIMVIMFLIVVMLVAWRIL